MLLLLLFILLFLCLLLPHKGRQRSSCEWKVTPDSLEELETLVNVQSCTTAHCVVVVALNVEVNVWISQRSASVLQSVKAGPLDWVGSRPENHRRSSQSERHKANGQLGKLLPNTWAGKRRLSPQTVLNGWQQRLINLQLWSAVLHQVEPSISRGLDGRHSASRCRFKASQLFRTTPPQEIFWWHFYIKLLAQGCILSWEAATSRRAAFP